MIGWRQEAVVEEQWQGASVSAEERLAELRQVRAARSPGWVQQCVAALLFDEDARVRAEAIAAMEHSAAAEAAPWLVEALGSSLRYARRRAAQALSRLPLDQVRPRLEAELEADRQGRATEQFGLVAEAPRLVRECVDLLGRLSDRKAIGCLLRLLGDPPDLPHPDPVVRARASAGLGMLLEHGAEPAELQAVAALLERTLHDRADEVTRAAARALGQLGLRRSVPALCSLLARDRLAEEAIAALEQIGPGLVPTTGELWLGVPEGPAGDGSVQVGPDRDAAVQLLLERLRTCEEPRAAGRLARGLLTLDAPGQAMLRQLVEAGVPGLPAAAGRAVARALLTQEAPGVAWSVLLAHPDPGCRRLAVRGLAREIPEDGQGVGRPGSAQPGAASEASRPDPDPGVRWQLEQARAPGMSWPAQRTARLRPHPRLALPSASPPYGLPLPAAPVHDPAPPRVGLAAYNLSISTNLGVLLRSAEAAGVQELFIIGDPRYHPGAARGTDRYVALTWLRDGQELLDLADDRGYGLVAIQQSCAAIRYDLAPYPPRPLFLLGAEAAGLPRDLLLAADLIVEIPLVGRIDSLNVATAGTIILFDWLRRQQFVGTTSLAPEQV